MHRVILVLAECLGNKTAEIAKDAEKRVTLRPLRPLRLTLTTVLNELAASKTQH